MKDQGQISRKLSKYAFSILYSFFLDIYFLNIDETMGLLTKATVNLNISSYTINHKE